MTTGMELICLYQPPSCAIGKSGNTWVTVASERIFPNQPLYLGLESPGRSSTYDQVWVYGLESDSRRGGGSFGVGSGHGSGHGSVIVVWATWLLNI